MNAIALSLSTVYLLANIGRLGRRCFSAFCSKEGLTTVWALRTLQEMCSKCSLLFARNQKTEKRSPASGSGRNVKRNCANVDCIAEAFAISNQKNLCKGEGNAGKPDMHTTEPNRAHTFPVCPLQISQAMLVLYKQD